MNRIVSLLPGLAIAAAATAVAWPISMLLPVLSPLLVAIVLGILLGNLAPNLPEPLMPGLNFAAKPLLRLGIVALGAQVVLGDILDLGWLVLVLAAVIVAAGICSALALAKPFKVDRPLAVLIGSGFGICGAAAVAGVESTLKSKKEDVAAAIGPAALEIAVLVKLARVIMLAPTVAVFSYAVRRSEAKAALTTQTTAEAAAGSRASAEAGSPSQGSGSGSTTTTAEKAPAPTKRPPIVPLFVIGFLAMAALRTFGLLPEFAVTGLNWIQTVFLAMAMFALGRGVQWRSLKNLGGGALGLAAAVTIIVAAIGLGGALLLT